MKSSNRGSPNSSKMFREIDQFPWRKVKLFFNMHPILSMDFLDQPISLCTTQLSFSACVRPNGFGLDRRKKDSERGGERIRYLH